MGGTARTLAVLAITQICAWGALGLPAVAGTSIAADLAIAPAVAFAGPSIFYVLMGLASPLLGPVFARYGARRVMIFGTTVMAMGFAMLSLADSLAVYAAGWGILGLAGAATLSTAAYVMLNEVAGAGAKQAIGGLMLMTGLSSSIFWPLSAVLCAQWGWQGACMAFAALMLVVNLPLLAFLLPRRAGRVAPATVPAADSVPEPGRGIFLLMSGAIAIGSFVTFGLSAVLIELLKAGGLDTATAVGFASALGVVQVTARLLDTLGGKSWDGLTTGMAASLLLPLAMVLLMVAGTAPWSVAGFILIYGLGSGALAVARATMPLVFFDSAAYARAMSAIALPLNLMSAAAPPIMAWLLFNQGGAALLGLTTACSLGCIGLLAVLVRYRTRRARRPRPA